MRYWLKSCPKCHGDLREESDIYGSYVACVQCGYILRTEEEQRLFLTGRLEPAPAEVRQMAA